MQKKIQSALISVFNKTDLEPLVRALNEQGVRIYSTGGTEKFINELGIQVIPVEEVTDYPSILGGRVKTLHPLVFGGILNRRDLASDQEQMVEYKIPEIDLVIVDLYPFEDTVNATNNESEIIEKIDIGGISLIRAAAKNYKDVVCISSRNQYAALTEVVKSQNGETSLEQRKSFAKDAFRQSSHYDTMIFKYFDQGIDTPTFNESIQEGRVLRYGENPHQEGRYYGNLEALFQKIQGKELSYNNLVDIDAAIHLMEEFKSAKPTFAILKHMNSCGLASADTISEAYLAALAGDNISAFGGILVSNKEIDEKAAMEINKLFFEVVIAPSYAGDALPLLQSKKNRIILIQKDCPLPTKTFKTLLNGVIEQDKDLSTESKEDFECITKKEPTAQEYLDLEFAVKAVKHLKSNTIALVKNHQLIGIGTGQTSRVDALQQSIAKAKQFGFSLDGAVMASDAFFPFPDCVEIAKNAGITAVVQPGGSIKDQDSIDYCNAHDLAMVKTGVRHFKH